MRCETLRIEHEWRDQSWPERWSLMASERQQRARPVLEQFAAWLDEQTPRLLPKSPLRQACEYAGNQWSALVR
ncbi:MAG: transposase, partial [Planctomycetaceae bacterium]|nr:transposase [Planctomycetaceae bacterium]